MSRITFVLVGSNLLAAVAGAHPGHGVAGEGMSLAHHLTEPIHAVAILALVGAVLAASRWLLGRPRGRVRIVR